MAHSIVQCSQLPPVPLMEFKITYSNAFYASEITSNDFFDFKNLFAQWIRHKNALFSYILTLPPLPPEYEVWDHMFRRMKQLWNHLQCVSRPRKPIDATN